MLFQGDFSVMSFNLIMELHPRPENDRRRHDTDWFHLQFIHILNMSDDVLLKRNTLPHDIVSDKCRDEHIYEVPDIDEIDL